MGVKLELTGQILGRLTVVSEAGRDKRGSVLWACVCNCGNRLEVKSSDLKGVKIHSCGCLKREILVKRSKTHGLSGHPLYVVWFNMNSRCYSESYVGYSSYGGRGIKVCDRWRLSLENFIADVSNGYKKGLQLDRKDNNGDYTPENTRWVSPLQNQMNKGKHKPATSIYKGVNWNKKLGKWEAKIKKGRVSTYLGLFLDEIDAAEAYNSAAKEFFGEYANLNIIPKRN